MLIKNQCPHGPSKVHMNTLPEIIPRRFVFGYPPKHAKKKFDSHIYRDLIRV